MSQRRRRRRRRPQALGWPRPAAASSAGSFRGEAAPNTRRQRGHDETHAAHADARPWIRTGRNSNDARAPLGPGPFAGDWQEMG
eukprot:5976347-Pyramimonas_sp.AAC.2